MDDKIERMKAVVLTLIEVYQSFSLFLHATMGIPPGRGCRFNPTCSEYTKQMIRERGVIKGLWLGTNQLARCHPWSS